MPKKVTNEPAGRGPLLTDAGRKLIKRMIEAEKALGERPFDAPGYAGKMPWWYPEPRPFAAGTTDALQHILDKDSKDGGD